MMAHSQLQLDKTKFYSFFCPIGQTSAGGVVNQDETLKDAAAREVLEETGIACDVGDIFMKTENDKYKITIFIAKYVKGEISIQEKEVQEARWFSKEEIKGLPLAYDTKAILLDYFNSKSKF